MHFHDGLGHAGESGELIDHPPDVGDLADDGVGALLEDLAVFGDGVAVFAANALGRKLDRRQRVLDLVCDAARHVGPGGRALSNDQLGDVVERHHVALSVAFAGHADGEVALRSGAAQRDLIGRKPLPLFLRTLQMLAEFRHDVGKLLADKLLLFEAEKFLGGAVDQIDGAVGVHAHDARGHAGEHGFHEAVALIERRIGADQLVALGLELRGHGVEG